MPESGRNRRGCSSGAGANIVSARRNPREFGRPASRLAPAFVSLLTRAGLGDKARYSGEVRKCNLRLWQVMQVMPSTSSGKATTPV